MVIIFGFILLCTMIPAKENLVKPKAKYKWYITACLFSSSKILGNWAQELLVLINALEPANVFVSIIENGDSTDNTVAQLDAFRIKLDKAKIRNTIVTKRIIERLHHRFKFLAEIRNEALKP